jgi:hypothetical protein
MISNTSTEPYVLQFVRPKDEYNCKIRNEFLKKYSISMDAKFSAYTENYTISQLDLSVFENVFRQFDNEYFEENSPVTNLDPRTDPHTRLVFILGRYTK